MKITGFLSHASDNEFVLLYNFNDDCKFYNFLINRYGVSSSFDYRMIKINLFKNHGYIHDFIGKSVTIEFTPKKYSFFSKQFNRHISIVKFYLNAIQVVSV